MKNLLWIALLLLNTHICLASTNDNKPIELMINDFKQSIKTKDKARFLELFVKPTSLIIGVYSEETMKYRRKLVEKINKEDGKSFKATKTFITSPTKMIDRIIADKAISDEEFSNIRIFSDGNIANVYFDYIYYKGGIKNNWGNESWQVVKTVNGWKIGSITYSLFFPQKELDT